MIQKLLLSDFRNFKEKLIEFPKDTTVIVGANASGKTNILEAINYLSTGKSFKAGVEQEVIKQDTEIARVKGKISTRNEFQVLEVVMTPGQISLGEEKTSRSPRKRLLIGGQGKRMRDFVGKFPSVLFSPLDMDLVISSPSKRRRFLDNVLAQADSEYLRSLRAYEKGLRHRNKLLSLIFERKAKRSELTYWDMLLIKNGSLITRKRADFIGYINVFDQEEFRQEFKLQYDKSVISEGRLQKYANAELAAGVTLVGPHRDDFIIFENRRDLSKYGSRGEQRLAVLWLKLSELDYIKSALDISPTLLLDDIFSELDEGHREVVAEVAKKQQTIITTADPDFLSNLKGVFEVKLSPDQKRQKN